MYLSDLHLPAVFPLHYYCHLIFHPGSERGNEQLAFIFVESQGAVRMFSHVCATVETSDH